MTDDRNSALLHLFAIVQGKRAKAYRQWHYARFPNWELDVAVNAATARLYYLRDFLRSRTHTRKLP